MELENQILANSATLIPEFPMAKSWKSREVIPTNAGLQLLLFEAKLAAAWPVAAWQDVTVLLAVSGGADSMALLRGMAALKQNGAGRLIVAHFNHRLRAAESDADEAFVADICQSLGFAAEIGRADGAALKSPGNDGLEAAARTARYRFLEETANRIGARYLVTAHTADDQAETILHRILRGTGLTGLAGIPRVRPLNPALSLIRPMLDFRRTEVLAYLESIGQTYRCDTSNHDQRFTRNQLRHDLLPRLQTEYNLQVVEALLQLGMLAGQAHATIDTAVQKLIQRCVRFESDAQVSIECRELATADAYLIRELLIAIWKQQRWPRQAMGYEKWNQLAQFVSSDSSEQIVSQRTFPGNIRAEKTSGMLVLSRSAIGQ